jgi:hypothetical protein
MYKMYEQELRAFVRRSVNFSQYAGKKNLNIGKYILQF